MKKLAREKAMLKAALKRAAIITARVNAPYKEQWATMEVYRREGKQHFVLVISGEKNWNGTITWDFNLYKINRHKRIPHKAPNGECFYFWGFTTEEHFDMYTNLVAEGFKEAAKVFKLKDPIINWKHVNKKIEIDY